MTSVMTGVRTAGHRGPMAAAEERELLRRWHEEGDRLAREQLVERMLPFVRHVARIYTGRGEQLEDLVQVGVVGLLNAIDRFDLDRGLRLSTFAAPNISGEIKRHFRDRSWAVRVPRDLQELSAKASRATERLSATLGRTPTVAELAAALGSDEEHVLEAIEAGRNYVAASLDEPGEDGEGLSRIPGVVDGGYILAEDRVMLREGLAALPARERQIVLLRFGRGLTQREIAEQVGISQMHVSRLLRRSIEQMRAVIDSRAAA